MDDLEAITKGRWQWKSNPDPWSKTEESKWEPYSLEQNYLIEKAYYDQQKEVDLGDYLVYPLDMLQRKKGNLKAQRPIRRVNWMDDEEMNDRSARYYETELPKTINKIFGSLEDFLNFFARRNPEMLEFASQFKVLEESNDLDVLNHRILPKLVNCFEKTLLKPHLDQLQDRSLSLFKKKLLLKIKKRTEDLILLFYKKFVNLGEFYQNILKAYTMDTELYPSLNKYLRNESWIEIDKFLPYVFCLCKAFFHLKLDIEMALDEARSSSITLHRGTTFNEFALRFYDMKTMKYFAWNSVTSTSKDKKIAEDFMYKTADLAEKKYPVMFIIEVPLTTEYKTEYSKWIDIHQYSAVPKEDEVILPPGSMFELIEVSTDRDQKTTIKIKLKNKVESLAHGGKMMQGALQSQMMTEKEAKIICLDGEELDEALLGLCGNKLIEGLEFCLCTFDERSLSKLFEILPTLEKARVLKFISCAYEGNRDVVTEKLQCNVTKIEISETNDFFQMICNEKYDQGYWVSLKELDLDFSSRRSLTDEELSCAVSEGLKYLRQLTYLNINLEWCTKITDAGVNSLANALSSLTQLAQLDMNFKKCQLIKDKGVKSLAQGLNSLTRLTHLNLVFTACAQISPKGAEILMSQGLINLTRLKFLTLDFIDGMRISNKKLNSLASHCLRYLFPLTFVRIQGGLSKDVSNTKTETEQESRSSSRVKLARGDSAKDKEIFSEEYVTLQNAQNLSYAIVSIFQKNKYTIDSAKTFSELCHSTSLIFSFEEHPHIVTDEFVHSLSSQVLRHPFQLESLTLNFSQSNLMTDQGVSYLVSSGLKHLVNLRSLRLDFEDCYQITDQGLFDLACEGLKHLSQLKSLTFRICQEVTDEGLRNMACHGLSNLSQLESLSLSLSCCWKVTDEGVDGLVCQGLRHLIHLKSLTFDISNCSKITNKGVNNLILRGVTHLRKLNFLDVNLTDCNTISDFTIRNIIKVLHYFGFKKEIDDNDEVMTLILHL